MDKGLKEKIILLRKEGKSYRNISKILKCSKGTISYHCKNNNLSDIGLKKNKLTKTEILDIINYSKNHTFNEISKKFNISKQTIGKYIKRDNKISNDKIIKINNFYKKHTIKETILEFNVSRSTILKYSDNKRVLLSDIESKNNNYKRLKNYRQKTKNKSIEYKGGVCTICGYSKCIWALEFHHKNPDEKEFVFSKYHNYNWEKIKKELDKCDIVCANCHREIHYQLYINGLNY